MLVYKPLYNVDNSLVQNIKAKIKKSILKDNILIIYIAIELRLYLLTYCQPFQFRVTDSKLNEVIIYSEK